MKNVAGKVLSSQVIVLEGGRILSSKKEPLGKATLLSHSLILLSNSGLASPGRSKSCEDFSPSSSSTQASSEILYSMPAAFFPGG